MLVGQTQVQRAVAELVALVDQGRPCGRVDLGAQGQVVVQAELGDGGRGGLAEAALLALVGVDLVAETAEPLLDVLDGRAVHTLANGVHVLSPRNRS